MNRSMGFPNIPHMKHVLARAAVFGVLLVLPSCAIPPFRPAQPGPVVPGTYNGVASPNNSAQLGIVEFFNDPILAALIDQGLAGNRELRVLEEEVEVARNEFLARSGAYLPFVGFRGASGVDKPSLFTPLGAAEKDLQFLPGHNFPDPVPNFLLSLDFFWRLDVWRELRNARDAAVQRYFAAVERRNFFVTRLVAEVAENYFALMAFDQRLANLDRIIQLQEDSLRTAKLRFEAGRVGASALPAQRFQASIYKFQSDKLIVRQDIIQAENRINFLVNRFPQPVERISARFFDLKFPLSVGLPAQLLQYRPDVRQAERELEAAGLDVKVARAHFFPRLDITGGVGYQAFDLRYLFWTPAALIYNVAGELVVPLINKRAIQAEYRTANAKQLQSVYNYQRVILNAFTEVVNRVSKVENYGRSIQIKRQQLESLESAVGSANRLYQAARGEYLDLLIAQRDLWDARLELIETRQQQLDAIAMAYQALGGGTLYFTPPDPAHSQAVGH